MSSRHDYALKARPWLNLLKKDTKFVFDIECVKSFEQFKRELTLFSLLSLYNPKAETELHTDASALGLEAILLQKQNSNHWAPVAYFSKTTNQAEAMYHSFELEMLAIIRAVERFYLYLYGVEFTVVTDCNVLVYAVNKANLNPRIARWTLSLRNYKFKVIHRQGKRMAHVDVLSKQIAYVGSLPLERQLEIKQLQDTTIKEIAQNLEHSDDDKFELIDGLVYKKGNDRSRFVIPESLINSLINIYHDQMARCGFEKTLTGINNTYWFLSMRKKIHEYVDNCVTCLLANSSAHRREGEMQLAEIPKLPFEIIHVDHFDQRFNKQ